MGKFLRGRSLTAAIIAVMMSVIIIGQVTAVSAATAETIYTSDLFYLYPYYLGTSDPDLNKCYNDADYVYTHISGNDELIMKVQTALKDPEGSILDAIADILGHETQMDRETNEEAAKCLVENLATSPGMFDLAISKNGDMKEIFEQLKFQTEWAVQLESMKKFGVDGKKIKKAVEENEALQEMSQCVQLLKTEQDIMEFAAVIVLCESLEMSQLDYIIDNVSDELAQPVKTYKNYINSSAFDQDYASYIAEKYFTEFAVEKIFNIETAIETFQKSGQDYAAAYSLVKTTCSMLADLEGYITGVGDAKDFITTAKMKYYVDQLRDANKAHLAYIKTNPVKYEDIEKYEIGYEIYVAALKGFAQKAKKIDNNYEQQLDNDIKVIKTYSVDDHYSRCKDAVRADEIRNTVTVDASKYYDYSDYTGDLQITGPSDKLEEGKIYTGAGKVYYSIKARNNVAITCNADMQDLEVTDNGTLNIDEGCQVSMRTLASSGNLELAPENRLTLNVQNIANHKEMSISNVLLNVSGNIIADSSDGDRKNKLSFSNCEINDAGSVVMTGRGGIGFGNTKITVNGNVTAEGGATGGLYIGSGTDMLVKGDMIIKASGGYWSTAYGTYKTYHYCEFNGGTVELKGDFRDDTAYDSDTVAAWICSDDFTLKMTGDKVQTIKSQIFRKVNTPSSSTSVPAGNLGKLYVTSPGIIVDGYLQLAELETDIKVLSDIASFNVKTPIDGKKIEISGSATIYNEGLDSSKVNTELTNGSTMTVGQDLTVNGRFSVTGASTLDVGGSFSGTYGYQSSVDSARGYTSFSGGSTVNIGQNAGVTGRATLGMGNVNITVGGNVTADGGARGGLYIGSGTDMLVKGDMIIKASGGYWSTAYGTYKTYHYCEFNGGTVELKGDFRDDTVYDSNTVAAWICSDDFTLKMTGDKVQTIKSQIFRKVNTPSSSTSVPAGNLGKLYVTSPGIIVDGYLQLAELETDIKVLSDIASFNVKTPIDGKKIEITGSATIYNEGLDSSKVNTELTNGSTMTVGQDLTVDGRFSVTGASTLDVGGSFSGTYTYQSGPDSARGYTSISNSVATINNDLNLSGRASFSVYNSSAEVGGNVNANGGARGGLSVGGGSEMLVDGDVIITANGSSSQSVYHYCNFADGTLEIKGDLKDDTVYTGSVVAGWVAGKDFCFRLTGDKVQTIKAPIYKRITVNSTSMYTDSLGKLYVTCPGLIVEGNLSADTVEQDLNINSCPAAINLTSWNKKGITLNGVDSLPEVTLPSGYGFKVTQAGDDLYDVVYEPFTGSLYTVRYMLDGKAVRTISRLEPESVVIPYEKLISSEDEFRWYADSECTAPWDFADNRITADTDIYGINLSEQLLKLKAELTALTEQAAAIEPDGYTEDSYAALAEELTRAQALLEAEQADAEQLRAEIEALRAAVDGLKPLGCQHEMIRTDAVAATCTEDGNIEYWTCSKCGKIFSDADGANEISQEDTAVPASGHDWGEWTVTTEATCTEAGEEQRVCSHDASHVESRATDAKGHTEEIIPAAAATCTETGLTEGKKCAVCGEILLAQEVIPATGHSWASEYTVDEPATYEHTGSMSIHCAVCGAIDEESIVELPVLEHNWGDWIITEEATCTKPGSMRRTCTDPDCHAEEVIEIPATGHHWAGEYTIDREATCEQEGSRSIHCTVCGEVREDSAVVIDKLPHSFDGAGTVTGEPTTEKEGTITYHCSICGKDIEESIPKLSQAQSDAYAEVESASEAAAEAENAAEAISETSSESDIASAESAIDEIVDAAGKAAEDAADALNEAAEKYGDDSEAVNYAQNKLQEALAAKARSMAAAATVKTAAAAAFANKAAEAKAAADSASAAPGAAAVAAAESAETAAKNAQTAAQIAYEAANAAFEAVKAAGFTSDSEEYKAAEEAVKAASAAKTAADNAVIEASAAVAAAKNAAAEVQPQPTPTPSPQPAPAATPQVREIQDLKAVKISKLKAAKKAVTVNWKKISKKDQKKIAGIEIQVATDAKFTNIVKQTTAKKSKTNKKITKLAAKTKYWVRIRTYKNVNGVKHVSAWKKKKIKTK